MPHTLRPFLLWTALTGLAIAPVACAPEGEDVGVDPTDFVVDADGDGYSNEEDCNDDDPDINPDGDEGTEVGDGLDNDCDYVIDEGTLSGDDDFDGYTEREGDCNDANPIIAPGLVDGCDSLDNDCDNKIDEDAVDAHEPNNDRALATRIGNDMTCLAEDVYLNLLSPTSAVDVDWLRFEVDNEDSIGCTFGVTATLTQILSGERVKMNIYRDNSTVPVESVDFTASQDDDSIMLQWVGDRSEEGGVFYLEISAPSRSSECRDDMRLIIQGQAPPNELPELPE